MNGQCGLIFDMDGLIADTEPLNARVTIRIFEDKFNVRGVKPSDFAAGIGKGAEAYIKAGARVHGLDLTDEQAKASAELREQYLTEAVRAEGLPAFPGVLDLIQEAMADGGFKLAVATSAGRELSEAVLDAVKVPYRQMVHVSGSDVTRKKPDPEIFLTAIERLGIEASRCVVFEDAPSGVLAARAAGARCIAVTNTVPVEKLAGADIICDSMEKVNLDMIRALLG